MASRIGADRSKLPNQQLTNSDDDSSDRVGDDSSLVDDSDSSDYSECDVPARNSASESPPRPRMKSGTRAASCSSTETLSASVSPPPSPEPQPPSVGKVGSVSTASPASPVSTISTASRTSPVLVVRTYSVREGRKATYRVHSTTSISASALDDSDAAAMERGLSVPDVMRHRAPDRKSLRVQVAKLVGAYSEVCVDLSYNWTDIDQTSGARTALATGLLSGGRSKKLSIDLSNRRIADLREGAEMRYRQGLGAKEWRKAIIDTEAVALAEALCKEIARVRREQVQMPEFGLVCHDQPLAGVVYPLVKALAAASPALNGLTRLDLNRYSRSAEVLEARPDSADAAEATERYVIRLAMLLGTTRSLRELGLRMNGLGALDLATLMVAGNATLTRLDLSCNPVCVRPDQQRSLKGLRELVRHLRKDDRLVELDLSFCGLDAAAADLLLKGLQGHRKLDKVNLTGNAIPTGHPIFRDARVQAGQGLGPRQ